MKKLTLLTVALFLAASAAFAQMQDELKETLTAKEKEMYEAIKNGDLDTFEANLADNYTGIYETGISEREQELENLGNLTIRSYELSDIQLMQPAEGVAILTYTLNGSGTFGEEEFNGTYYCSSTWIMEGDQWKGLLHTETEAATSPERTTSVDY